MFSPENMSSESPYELDSDALKNTDQQPIERFQVSNLDINNDDSMDETEPLCVLVCHFCFTREP